MFAKVTLLSLVTPLLLATITQAGLVRRQSEVELPGSPGEYSAPDYYSTHTGVDWNRTYGAHEPQQIHLSLTSESKYVRVEFATLESVSKAIFKYWPKNKAHAVTLSNGKDWTFVDGGEAKRPLYLHKIKSKALKPATTYAYQVGAMTSNNGTQWSPVYEFHTASRRNEFNFIAIADIGINNAVALPHVIDAAKSHKYDFVTVSGDQAYNMDDFNGTKGDEFLNLWQEVYARVPFMGVPGNHEAAYNYSHYKNRFDNLPYAESHFENSLMYSFDYKSLHLVSFSTELYFDGTPEMLQTGLNWLEADLKEANKHRKQRPWIVLITHHPIYCSVVSSDCDSKAALIRDGPLASDNKTHWGGLEELLLKYKVDVYLSGHVHNYERTYPVAHGKTTSTSYHNAPSYMEVIVGNGGQPEQTVPFNTTGPFADWSAKRYDGYGFSLVNVTPKTFKMTHYEAKLDGSLGKVIDEFTLSKD